MLGNNQNVPFLSACLFSHFSIPQDFGLYITRLAVALTLQLMDAELLNSFRLLTPNVKDLVVLAWVTTPLVLPS